LEHFLMTEREIGNYRVLKQIGAGGMAKVYLAVHKDVPNLKVVLKILSDPRHAARFMQEADKLALLERNPNICHIRHFFNHEDELVIAMEYIDGKSLEEMIAEKGKFAVDETLGIVDGLLAALAFAHDKGIYHRDIKPGNVMFDRDGQLKVIDFGIAKGKTDPQMTIVGTAAGTPEYMAPEQFAGGEGIDYAKCDIYAVGTMMYKMLAGRAPFIGDNEFVLRDMKLLENPEPPSRFNEDIPGALDGIILKAIDKDPSKRYASVADMRSELSRLSGTHAPAAKGPATEAAAAPPAGRPAKRGGRGKIAGAVIGVVVVAAAAIVGIRMMSGGDGGDGTIPAAGSGETARPAVTDTQRAIENALPSRDDSTTREERAENTGAPARSTAAREKPAAETAGTAAGSETAPVGAQPPKPRPAAPGFLKVLSRPRNAAIYINGERQYETTPFTFERPPGRYDVRIVAVVGGTERSYSTSVTLESGGTQIVSHAFEE
jgi:eukaryotic-like serine/threonine-protein kinase